MIGNNVAFIVEGKEADPERFLSDFPSDLLLMCHYGHNDRVNATAAVTVMMINGRSSTRDGAMSSLRRRTQAPSAEEVRVLRVCTSPSLLQIFLSPSSTLRELFFFHLAGLHQ